MPSIELTQNEKDLLIVSISHYKEDCTYYKECLEEHKYDRGCCDYYRHELARNQRRIKEVDGILSKIGGK